ncbi:hypothetical protein I6B53_04450 [Schaalia sp. 19OD2882]|uniref:hypothetical protein n=1 Tax=Schaalia sp. 19OD2882 TaxID=2794089 RepID=UPI001C1F095D|nr:hypothetical protein [Schaalia sp. 19OD2882]QWW20343.1 hypothetical protein I6B53_04450 [Schaalia sp. 19OD2882]
MSDLDHQSTDQGPGNPEATHSRGRRDRSISVTADEEVKAARSGSRYVWSALVATIVFSHLTSVVLVSLMAPGDVDISQSSFAEDLVKTLTTRLDRILEWDDFSQVTSLLAFVAAMIFPLGAALNQCIDRLRGLWYAVDQEPGLRRRNANWGEMGSLRLLVLMLLLVHVVVSALPLVAFYGVALHSGPRILAALSLVLAMSCLIQVVRLLVSYWTFSDFEVALSLPEHRSRVQSLHDRDSKWPKWISGILLVVAICVGACPILCAAQGANPWSQFPVLVFASWPVVINSWRHATILTSRRSLLVNLLFYDLPGLFVAAVILIALEISFDHGKEGNCQLSTWVFGMAGLLLTLAVILRDARLAGYLGGAGDLGCLLVEDHRNRRAVSGWQKAWAIAFCAGVILLVCGPWILVGDVGLSFVSLLAVSAGLRAAYVTLRAGFCAVMSSSFAGVGILVSMLVLLVGRAATSESFGPAVISLVGVLIVLVFGWGPLLTPRWPWLKRCPLDLLAAWGREADLAALDRGLKERGDTLDDLVKRLEEGVCEGRPVACWAPPRSARTGAK